MNTGEMTLNGRRYSVRADKTKREVLLNEVWVDHEVFCEYLASNKMWTELFDLAKIGSQISKGEKVQPKKIIEERFQMRNN